MRAFTTGELDRLQDTQEGAMQDVCQILVYSSTADDYNNPVPAHAVGVDQADQEVACGVQHVAPTEEMASGEVPVISVVIRLALDTTLDERDRIKVTHRFGVLLDTAQVFEIEGPVKRGPSGLVVNGRQVTDGSE